MLPSNLFVPIAANPLQNLAFTNYVMLQHASNTTNLRVNVSPVEETSVNIEDRDLPSVSVCKVESALPEDESCELQSSTLSQSVDDLTEENNVREEGNFSQSKLSKIEEEIWTPERTKLLLQWAKDCKNDWKKIAKRFKNRKITPSRVRAKYRAMTQENYKEQRVKFSRKEDLILAKYFAVYGYEWDKIAKYFPSRNSMMIKNRYYAGIRKKNLLDSLLAEVAELERKNNKPIEEIDI